MAIIRKAPNGELVSFPDGTTEAQIQETFNSEQYQSAKVIDKPTEAGVLSDLPPALKNNWAFDTFAVAPYEASRKAINSANTHLLQGDVLKMNVGYKGPTKMDCNGKAWAKSNWKNEDIGSDI